MRVLIVEDSPADAYLEKMTLRAILGGQFDVRCAGGLDAAADLMVENDFDVILLDLGLPESLGAETVKQLRDLDQTTPIVVLTGNDDHQLALQTLNLGAQEFVPKSELGPDRLHQAMRSAILRMEQQTEQDESRTREEVAHESV